MPKVKGTPLGSHLLVLPDVEEEGIIIKPSTAIKDRPQLGTVLAAGPGKVQMMMVNGEPREVHLPMGTKIGDRILFGRYTGIEMKLSGQDVIVMSDEDVIMVVDADAEAELFE